MTAHWFHVIPNLWWLYIHQTLDALTVIPHSYNKTLVTKLVVKNNLLTLKEADQTALATYPALEELYLDGNLVTAIPAKYFTVVPNLRVLSLSRNKLSR